VAAIVVALVLQAALLMRVTVISPDGITFIRIAKQLATEPAEAFRTNDQHPGYPMMILAAERLAQAAGLGSENVVWAMAAQTVAAVCGLLLVLVSWLFARSMFDVVVADIAAFITAVLPVMRGSAVDALSDTPHLLFYLLAAWCACSWVKHLQWRFVVGGALASGGAFWIRPEGLEPVLVFAGLMLLMAARARIAWSTALWGTACLAGIAFCVVAPYVWVAGKVTSKQVAVAKQLIKPADTVASSPSLGGPGAIAASAAASNSAGNFAADTSSPLKRRLKRTLQGVNEFIRRISHGFRYVFLPLYLVGNFEMVRRRFNGWQIVFISLLAVLHIAILGAVFAISGYIDYRHIMPLVALALPTTALGVLLVSRKLDNLIGNVAPVEFTAALVLGLCSALVIPANFRPLNLEFQGVRNAIAWVEQHSGPRDGVLSNSPYVPFYSQRPAAFLAPYDTNIDKALSRAALTDCTYVVVHAHAVGYKPEWLGQIEQRFLCVLSLDDPRSPLRDTKVLVFKSKAALAGRPPTQL